MTCSNLITMFITANLTHCLNKEAHIWYYFKSIVVKESLTFGMR